MRIHKVRAALALVIHGMVVAVTASLACNAASTKIIGPANQNAGTIDTSTPKFTLTLTVAPPSATVSVGTSTQLSTTLDSNGVTISKPVVWASTDSTTVTVSGSGFTVAVKTGSAVVIATSGGKAATVPFTVVAVPVDTVIVTPALDTLQQGTSLQLSVATKDANGNTLTGRIVSWNSNNVGVASVNSSTGKVQALAVGSATITAISEGKTDTSRIVVVNIPVATVVVTAAKDTVQVGKMVQFTATTKDAGSNVLTGRLVTWTSSDTNIAKVNSSGQVTGRAVGTAVITATSETQIGTHGVTVIPVPVAYVQVLPTNLAVALGGQGMVLAQARDSNGNLLSGRSVTWNSSNTAVLGLTAKGDTALLQGIDTGTAAVKARVDNESTTVSISVNPLSGFPSPKLTDFIIRDTRALHQNSISTATSLSGALTAAGLFIDESCSSGNCVGPGFTTSVTPNGEHAFIWNVKKNAGNPAGCISGGPSQHNWKIWLNTGAINANGEIFLQYKYWSGQTGTGGGTAGNVGVFSHEGGAGGHKDVVWFRQRNGSLTSDGRFTMATESETPSAGQKVLWDLIPSEPLAGSGGDILARDVGVVFEKNNYINQIVTVTYRIRPESSAGAGDGLFQQWMNNTLVINLQNQHTGTIGWGEVQIGGPTWICPTQDQTMYYWDIIMWQPR